MGAIILAVIFKIWKINFSNVRWKAIFSYGMALAGMNALFYLSLERLPLGLAVAFEFIFLGETLLWNQWLALMTIIIASIGCTVTTQHARQQKEAYEKSPIACRAVHGFIHGGLPDQCLICQTVDCNP